MSEKWLPSLLLWAIASGLTENRYFTPNKFMSQQSVPMVYRAVVAKMWVLARYSRGKQELGSFSDLRYVCCGLLTLYVWRSERAGGVVWFGKHGGWAVGNKVKRGRRRIASREACLIPAPKDVLLLFQLYLSEFCSLMKLDGPIFLGILERCLPSCLLSPTSLHYCFTWGGVAHFVPLPGKSLFWAHRTKYT